MPTTALIAAGVGAAGSIGAAAIGASAQTSAASKAAATETNLYQQGVSEVQPYVNAGTQSEELYNYLTGAGPAPAGVAGQTGTGTNGAPTTLQSGYNPLTAPLTAPFTAATLPSTPGYQFTLDQGLKSTQNSYAALGLGSSGAAEKGAASYATGLAQSTYNQQLTNYLTQNQQIANLLYQPVTTGAGAAGTALGGAVATGSNVGSADIGAGNAIAGAATGAANGLTGGVNTALQYSLLNQYLQNQSGNNITGAVNSYNTNAIATNDTISNWLTNNPGSIG